MTESKREKVAKNLRDNLMVKWRDMQQKIRFCLDHKFEFEAQIIQKQAALLYDVITLIEIEFEIK